MKTPGALGAANAVDRTALLTLAAQNNNPRINPMMATPPTIAGGTTPDATLTNAYAWNASNAGVFNFYGGKPTDNGAGGAKFPCVTVSGVYSAYVWRMETVVDAVKVQYKVQGVASTGVVNFIVDGQYVGGTVVALPSGLSYVTLDFTSAGGRKVRTIIMEGNATAQFWNVSILPTETLTKPGGTVIRMANVGDSFTAGGGMVPAFVGYAQILPDMLGIRDIWNLGIGGTGYLEPGPQNQTTCIQRMADIIASAPDILMVTAGHNDTVNFTPDQLQAAVGAFLAAVRAQSILANIPIIVCPLWGNRPIATSMQYETAMQAAVTSFDDPLVYMITDANDPNGPAITGTGWIGGTQDGNAGVYIAAADHIHPYQVNYTASPAGGHWFYATWLRDKLMRQVFVS